MSGRISSAARAWLVALLWSAGLATGCLPAGPPSDPALSTAAPSLSPALTATPSPQASPTSTETATPTATPEPTATNTAPPMPTPAPSPSPTATPCPETAGRVVAGVFPSPIQGGEQRYRIYLPPCYGQSGRLYPTLYLFHGNIHTEAYWDDLGVDEAADAGIAAGRLPPFLIVLPFGGEIANATSGGGRSFEGVVLNDLIPYIEDSYCAWPEAAGRAIGGLSRGGYWSLEIGFRHTELFAAVGGHSAALFPDNAGRAHNPLSTGANPSLDGLPIYIDIGEADYLRSGASELHGVLTRARVSHVWQLNPGRHEDAYWRAHQAEYLAWYAAYWPAGASEYPSATGRSCSP